jgi:hypothetical protein
MQSKQDTEELFVKAHLEGTKQVVELLGDRRLQPRDAAVLMGLLSHVSWRSGKAQVSAGHLAEELGMIDKHVISSITRLRKELVVTKLLEDGLPYYLLNPWMFSVGAPQQRGYFKKLFSDSL